MVNLSGLKVIYPVLIPNRKEKNVTILITTDMYKYYQYLYHYGTY